jgi:outer membrane lipoprotein carrier protein
MWTPTIWLFTTIALSLPPQPAPAPSEPTAPPAVVAKAVSADPVAPVAPSVEERAEPVVAQQLAATGEDAKLSKAIASLQKAYEGTNDFAASFEQRYTYTLLRRTQVSHGTVRFKKPGLMRWNYTKPSKKSFIVNEGKLWVHQPEDKVALVDHCFKEDGLTASVSFLWGSGDITGQFNVSWFEGVFGEKSDLHLKLEPKTKNSVFARLILVLDPKTHRVKQSVVVDLQGNVNQFLYSDLKFNSGLKKKDFAFSAPKGTHESRIPGSCDPAAKGATK